MVSDGVLVIPRYNLHDAEKHTVCWQRREAGRIGRKGGGRDFTTYFSFSFRCRLSDISGEISESILRKITDCVEKMECTHGRLKKKLKKEIIRCESMMER